MQSKTLSPSEQAVVSGVQGLIADITKFAGPLEVMVPLVDILFVGKAYRNPSTSKMAQRALEALLGNLYALRASLALAQSQLDLAKAMPDYVEFLGFLKSQGLDFESVFTAVMAKGDHLAEDIARFEDYKKLFEIGE